jgi:predicted NAD-dependent protein-ADP-ribosyltransferase YbiA (DUF1768 family)
MVLSKLDGRIKYDESRLVYDEDIGMDASLYEIFPDTLEYKIHVAIGNIKYTYVDKDVVFFPIYLIKNNEIIMRIGVFEVLSNNIPALMNDLNEIDLTRLNNNEPLLFSYANKKTLREYSSDKPNVNLNSEDNKNEKDEKEEDGDEVFETTSAIGKQELDIETEESSKEERENYVERVNITWIEKFMKNNNYSLLDNEGEGDCFFYVLRDAFLGIGKETNVTKLRNVLSYEADEETFQTYKLLFDNYKSSLVSSKDESEKVKGELKLLKDKFKLTKDRNTQLMLQKQMKNKVDDFNRIKAEVELTKENLKEVKIMSGVKNLENFRKKLRSCEFWADTWALSTMERMMNVKLILLSSEAYDTDDKDNVLVCGQMNDSKLEGAGIFNPDYYIIVDFVGDHYKLITYKDKRMLTFQEIPYDLKRLILLKCLEGNDGYYNLIPDFAELKEQYKKVDEDEDLPIVVEEGDKLFNDKTVFQVYPKSNDKPLPGKGSGETIEKSDNRFAELHKIMNWRKKLANSWDEPFELDGYNWSTVEHYINANKFLSNSDFYKLFNIESGNKIAKAVELAIDAGDEKKSKLRPKDIKIDDEYDMNKSNILEKGLFAKFSQNVSLKNLLLETKDAKIVHYKRGGDAIILTELMRVREKLNK